MLRWLLYPGYRWVAGMAYRLARRFTAPGKFLLVCLLLFALFGLDTNRTTAHQVFAFAAVLLAGSLLWVLGAWLVQRRAGPAFDVTRQLPRFGTAGEPLSYYASVRNGTGRPQRGAVLLEDLADPRPTRREFVAGRRRGRAPGVSWLDDAMGFTAWRQRVTRAQPGTLREAAIADLPPGGEVEVKMELAPRARGRIRFVGATVARPDLFGLLRTHDRVPLAQSLLVLPRRYPLPALALPGARQYQQGGVAFASSVGQSDEFVALRDYRPGDPLRHIHWRSVARTDKLIVREFEDEFFVRHALILDTFAVPGQEAAFEEAVSVASSFACTVQTQESLLDLLFVGPAAYCFTAGRGVGHVDRMLEVLAGVEPCTDKPFSALGALVTQHAGAVSGAVVILLAWDQPRQDLVGFLTAQGLPLRVLVITGAAVTAPLDPGPLRTRAGEFHQLRVGQIAEGLARV